MRLVLLAQFPIPFRKHQKESVKEAIVMHNLNRISLLVIQTVIKAQFTKSIKVHHPKLCLIKILSIIQIISTIIKVLSTIIALHSVEKIQKYTRNPIANMEKEYLQQQQ